MKVGEAMPIIAIITVLWFIGFGIYVDWFEKYERRRGRDNSFPNNDWQDF